MGVSEYLKKASREGDSQVNLAGEKLRKLPINEFAAHYPPAKATALTLSNNNITKLDDADIVQFSKLTSLNLFGNRLKELPKGVGTLTLLEFFTASNNRIKELPHGFGGMPKIRVLDLSANYLTDLRSLTLLTSLNELYISDNKLTELPEDFGKLKSLEVACSHSLVQCCRRIQLSLRNNRLETLPPSFAQLTALKTLYMQNNRLKQLPRHFGISTHDGPPSWFLVSVATHRHPCIAYIAQCTALDVLELYGNPLHPCIIDAFKTGIQYLLVFLQRPDYEEQLQHKVKRSRLSRMAKVDSKK
ncbi:hypothetical protein BCR44DRAFT_96565 [Catenaria anguillulae PL171]|uniref:Uncharacterized protein n=1 Tax=Catenaria anguillulae PL171 TaxID=765915 RepID=A0A1Y2HQT7_9FUNG|nr:hypothetical protein BCR44DRAFT_96565 [Catenaria anguillulae PL171]